MTTSNRTFYRVQLPPGPAELKNLTAAAPVGPAALASRTIVPALHSHRAAAASFQPDAPLVNAINVALSVGAPLLVTGEPGTGKTQVAWWLAWYFGLLGPENKPGGSPFVLNVKSTTVSTDLLYQFDTVAYFHAGQDPARRGQPLSPTEFRTPGPLWRAFEELAAGRPAIVLLDEIDKASRDFPNDLLHELDEYSFTVRETGETIARPADQAPPVVVITSNSERRLPEPFLRRCVFHHIGFTEELLWRAVRARAHETPRLDDAARGAAVRTVQTIRERPGIRKKPATGELLMWLVALDALGVDAAALGPGVPLGELPALSALIKDHEDLVTLAG